MIDQDGRFINCKISFYNDDYCSKCKSNFYLDEKDNLCYSNTNKFKNAPGYLIINV